MLWEKLSISKLSTAPFVTEILHEKCGLPSVADYVVLNIKSTELILDQKSHFRSDYQEIITKPCDISEHTLTALRLITLMTLTN